MHSIGTLPVAVTCVQHHGLEALLERNGTCKQLLDTTTGKEGRHNTPAFSSVIQLGPALEPAAASCHAPACAVLAAPLSTCCRKQRGLTRLPIMPCPHDMA